MKFLKIILRFFRLYKTASAWCIEESNINFTVICAKNQIFNKLLDQNIYSVFRIALLFTDVTQQESDRLVLGSQVSM